MNRIDEFIETFRMRLDRFFIGCDSQEEIKTWDLEIYGEMDVFYLGELVSIILKLIVSDGVISENEVEYLNKNFGVSYSLENLEMIYDNCNSEIEDSFDARLKSDIEMLRAVNERLVEEFIGLIELICDIIAIGDGTYKEEEQNEIRNILSVVKTS